MLYGVCTCNWNQFPIWDEEEGKYECLTHSYCLYCQQDWQTRATADLLPLAESLGAAVADLQRWLDGPTAAYVRPSFSGRRARRARAERARRKA